MTLSGRNERGVCVRTVHETNSPWEISIGKGEKALRLFIYTLFFNKNKLNKNIEAEIARKIRTI